jgi:hypothetical protein
MEEQRRSPYTVFDLNKIAPSSQISIMTSRSTIGGASGEKRAAAQGERIDQICIMSWLPPMAHLYYRFVQTVLKDVGEANVVISNHLLPLAKLNG